MVLACETMVVGVVGETSQVALVVDLEDMVVVVVGMARWKDEEADLIIVTDLHRVSEIETGVTVEAPTEDGVGAVTEVGVGVEVEVEVGATVEVIVGVEVGAGAAVLTDTMVEIVIQVVFLDLMFLHPQLLLSQYLNLFHYLVLLLPTQIVC